MFSADGAIKVSFVAAEPDIFDALLGNEVTSHAVHVSDFLYVS